MNDSLIVPPEARPGLLPIVYCYSGARWSNYPGRQFALMREMAAQTPVFFLNDPVIKGYAVEFRLPTAEPIFDGLTVIHNAFTFRSCRSGKRLGPAAAAPDSWAFHRLLKKLGVEDYIFWVASPRRSLLWGVRTDHLVYDCIDPAPETSGHNHLHDVETWFAHRARLVFCTAESLQARLQPENPRCHLLCNAAGARDFPDDIPRAVPEALRGLRRPIAGCIGTVDFRIDYPLLTAVAKRLPHVTFVIAGYIASPPETLRELRALPNVVLTGETDDEVGRAFIASFDVGLIPFNTGVMGDGINPVKLYMYLAAGKPVVSTWMQECRRHAPLVTATDGAEAFARAIEDELRTDAPAKAAARVAFARRNTWRARAEQAAEHLRDAGLTTGKGV
jgi:glycosyltransferase involved in cell wall biosynthesis